MKIIDCNSDCESVNFHKWFSVLVTKLDSNYYKCDLYIVHLLPIFFYYYISSRFCRHLRFIYINQKKDKKNHLHFHNHSNLHHIHIFFFKFGFKFPSFFGEYLVNNLIKKNVILNFHSIYSGTDQ